MQLLPIDGVYLSPSTYVWSFGALMNIILCVVCDEKVICLDISIILLILQIFILDLFGHILIFTVFQTMKEELVDQCFLCGDPGQQCQVNNNLLIGNFLV